MRLLYNILLPVFFLLSAPYYLWKLLRRGGWRAGFFQRLGWHAPALREALAGRRVLWIHAVSVGEATLAAQLVSELGSLLSGWELVVSTTTTTGMAVLRKQLPPGAHTVYFPVDLLPCVRAAWRALNPAAVVLMEAEVWPNFLWQAQSQGVPVALANARLSDRSWRGYRRWSGIFAPFFSGLHCVGAANEADAVRLRQLGCLESCVEVTGNMKFDGAAAPREPGLDAGAILRQIGAAEGAPVLVAGSTHEGEEELLAQVAVRLRRAHPGLVLVLVPRHFERAPAVAEQLRSLGVSFQLRTSLRPSDAAAAGCLLVDTTGELRAFYEAATVVFVGKSLRAQGGQNPIEPAALGKPVVFGPHMQNFRAVVGMLLAERAAVQLADEDELEPVLAALLDDAPERKALGERARAVVCANQGATQRTAAMVARMLEPAGGGPGSDLRN